MGWLSLSAACLWWWATEAGIRYDGASLAHLMGDCTSILLDGSLSFINTVWVSFIFTVCVGGDLAPHVVQGSGEGSTIRAVVLQEGAWIQQVGGGRGLQQRQWGEEGARTEHFCSQWEW